MSTLQKTDLMGELDRLADGQILIPRPGDANYGEWGQFKTDAGLEGRTGTFWNPEVLGVHGNRYRLFANQARHGLEGSGNQAFADMPTDRLEGLAALLRAMRRDSGRAVPWELLEPEEACYGPDEILSDDWSDVPSLSAVVWAEPAAPIRSAGVRSPRMSDEQKQPAPRLSNSDPDLVAAARELAGRLEIVDKARADLVVQRDAMVADLRAAGWGYDRIANALGMTKSRVQQLCR